MKRTTVFIILIAFLTALPAVAEEAGDDELFKQAEELFKKEQFKDAAKLYKQHIETAENPEPAARCNLGYSYYRLDKLKKAEKVLAEAREKAENKKSGAYHCASGYLGFVYSAMGDHDKAITLHEELTEVMPRYWHSWYGLGKAYVLAGDYNNAKAPLDKAYSMNAKFPHTAYYQGLAYYNLEDYRKAHIYFQRAVNIDRNNELRRLSNTSEEQLKELLEEVEVEEKFTEMLDKTNKKLEEARTNGTGKRGEGPGK